MDTKLTRRTTTTKKELTSSPHPSSSSSASSSSSLPRTPKPNNTLSSPPQSHRTTKSRTKTETTRITPNNLNNLLNQKPIPNPALKQAAMNHLIQTLSTLRSKHHIHHHLEQPCSKRIKIQAAPDGSASLVLTSIQPSLDPSDCYYYYHHQQQQHLHYPPPTTIAPATLFLSPSSNSSSSSNPLLASETTNQHSPLVSATTQEYGRVIMKKDALINKLGLEAAQRAIRKARSQRKPYRSSGIHPSSSSLSSSSSPPSSPQTTCWRTGTIGKWLESADDDSEDEEEDRRCKFPRGRDLMGSLSKLAKQESSTSAQPSSSSTDQANDPQSLFWSPIKPKKKEEPEIVATKRAPQSASIAAPIDSQQILERIGRMSALEMGIRWPTDRPSTPPNQQSFFHIDELSAARGHRHPADRLSQLSFGSHSATGGSGSLQTSMLKPGCNLSQAFLVRAASPTILLSAPAPTDENRSPLVLAPQPHLSPSLPTRPYTNDFSPCSPVRHDLLKLIDQHHGSDRLDSPKPLAAFSPFQSTSSTEHRWLTELDTNSLAHLNFDNPFSSPTPDPPLEDFLGYV